MNVGTLPHMRLIDAAKLHGVHSKTMRRWIEKKFRIRLPRRRGQSPLVAVYQVREVVGERTGRPVA